MSQATDVLSALGGWDNIRTIEACITRLRVDVGDIDLVDDDALTQAGAFGVVRVGSAVQVILGTETDSVAAEIDKLR